MFGSLKKKLKDSVSKLADKVKSKEEEFEEQEEEKKEKPKEKKPAPKPKKEKPAKKPEPKPKAEKKTPPKPEKAKEEPAEEPEDHLEEKVDEEVTEMVVDGDLAEEVEKPIEEKIEEAEEEIEPPVPEPKPDELRKEKRGFLGRIRKKVVEKTLSEEDIDDFFKDVEIEMLEANVALEVVDAMKDGLKKRLAGMDIRRSKSEDAIKEAFEESLYDIVNQGESDIEKLIQGKVPATIVVLGFNGSGKTTSIAKMTQYLIGRGRRPVLAAADTFRAASIEQLEHHGEKLGVKVIKHQYGADAAAVVFDAKKHAESKMCDVVLADTAGRSHADANLLDELKKLVRVNSPELKILVIDSLTGNDAVEQAKKFHEVVGVDGIILTKIDVNKKGGSILSAAWAIKKPILFLGTGQGYEKLEPFDPRKFVKTLLE
jgi:fused signal recognition particle receptor